VAKSGNGSVVATHTIIGSGTGIPAALVSSIDFPSPASGTGSKVVLDGQDAALVRFSLVDHAGVHISNTVQSVTFKIASGPGSIVGVGSGDPASHAYQQGVVADTFAGSIKVLVRVNVDCVSPNRMLAAAIDLEQGKGEGTVKVERDCAKYLGTPIIIQATAANGFTATRSVEVSGDVHADGWLAVAKATGNNLNYTFMEDFVE
jgi:hypothetical protein